VAIWDDVITDQDRLVYEASGYGEGRIGLGSKPALVIIDVTYNFTGDKSEPVLESIKRFPYSCGEVGWQAIHHIMLLLPLVRERRIPVVYSVPSIEPKPDGWISIKSSRAGEIGLAPQNNEVVREVAPSGNDIVIYKTRPSIFYGTPILGMLHGLGVDTLLVCGTTTSGCVRASVIEAFSNNFRVAVIEECTFDRGEISHKINLFDMNAKYADVVSTSEVRAYLNKL